MNRIDLVPRGWEQESWIREFYPDDLPEEWRLCYFANEFSSVLLPRATWMGVADDVVTEWAADLPAQFRIYLEGACAAHWGKLGRVLSAFGERVAGVVNDGRAIQKSAYVAFSFCEAPVEAVRFAGPLACAIPGPSIDDLPAARRLLDDLVPRPGLAPVLVILDPVSPDALHRWWQLAYLAGLA